MAATLLALLVANLVTAAVHRARADRRLGFLDVVYFALDHEQKYLGTDTERLGDFDDRAVRRGRTHCVVASVAVMGVSWLLLD